MGEAIENLIALASAASLASQHERIDVARLVKAHTRVQNGRIVQVDSYLRTPVSMSKEEIEAEIFTLRTADTDLTDDHQDVRNRARLTALLREAAARSRAGTWGNDVRDQLNPRNPWDGDKGGDQLRYSNLPATIHYPPGHPKAGT